MTKELSLAEMAELAAEFEDQTQETEHSDFDNRPEAGVTVGRLISYIELGKHDGGSYQGKKKADADKVRIEFELLGPKNIVEFEKDGVKQQFGQTVSITLKKSLSDKAKFRKLFKKLQYGRDDKKHIAQMIGEAFIIMIYHNKVTKDGKELTYVNLDLDGEYGISAPFQVDPITRVKTAYDIKAHTQPLRLFLWDRPQPSMWDSLFIDGTWEKKTTDDKGVETTTNVSKNFLQELILSAKNYAGSPLHTMLNGLVDLPTSEAEVQSENPAPVGVQQEQQKAAEQPASNEAEIAAAMQAATPTTAPQADPAPASVDPLAALGLTTVKS